MGSLKRIAKHISENNLSEKDVYGILKDYCQKEVRKAWVRGWLRRSGLSRASKRASHTSVGKCMLLDEEFQDYAEADLSRPIPLGTLIDVGGDYKEAKDVVAGEKILFKGEYKKVLEVDVEEKVVLLRF